MVVVTVDSVHDVFVEDFSEALVVDVDLVIGVLEELVDLITGVLEELVDLLIGVLEELVDSTFNFSEESGHQVVKTVTTPLLIVVIVD